MTLSEFSEFLDKKIEENDRYVRISFYELRIEYDLSAKETDNFIKLAKNKLNNLGYEVYTREKDNSHQNDIIELKDNELLVAVKG